MKRKTYKTKQLELRPYLRGDYDEWLKVYALGQAKKNKYDLAPRKIEECSRKVFLEIRKRHEKLAKKDECYIYGVFHRKSGALVGAVDLFVIQRRDYQMANLGYRIFNRYWGMGYGKESVKALMRIGFSDLRLNRLEAAINIGNKRSLALARSVGMRSEGIKRRYLYEDGAWTDQIIYAANPEDVGLKGQVPN